MTDSRQTTPKLITEPATDPAKPPISPPAPVAAAKPPVSLLAPAVAVPALLILVGAVLAFLGMNRLANFDAEIRGLRNDLQRQADVEKTLAVNDRSEFKAENRHAMDAMRQGLETQLAQFQQILETLAEKTLQDEIEQELEALRQSIRDFETDYGEKLASIKKDLEPYAWLEERKEEVDLLVGLETIGVAHQRVSELFRQGKTDMALRVSRYAADQKLPGSLVDFHNLATELAQHAHYPLASQIIENGLEAFPTDIDLLADAVIFAFNTGDLTSAEAALEQLREIDYERWNWRPFVFGGDLLEALGRPEEAMELYQTFQELIPFDERAYSQPGEYYSGLGRYEQVIEYCERGLERCPRAPQCALFLAQSYMAIAEYEKAIHAADRAIEGTATLQPTVSQAAVLWERASAEDALFHQRISTELRNDHSWRIDETTLRLAQNAIIDYSTVLALSDQDEHRSQGSDRITILQSVLVRLGVTAEVLADIIDSSKLDTGPSSSTQSLEALYAGSLEEFLEFLEANYYDGEVWEERVGRLFPDFDSSEYLIATGRNPAAMADLPEELAVKVVQDLLAGWVLENREWLEWNEGVGKFELRTSDSENGAPPISPNKGPRD